MSFWRVPDERAPLDAGLVGHADVHREDRCGGRVDRHGGRDPAEVDAREEGLHVGHGCRRRPRPGPPRPWPSGSSESRPSRVGMSKAVESPSPPARSSSLKRPLVSSARPEAGELAHRPQAGAVHGRVRAPGVGVLAGQLGALGAVDGLERHARHRLEARRPKRRAVELLLPRAPVGHAPNGT